MEKGTVVVVPCLFSRGGFPNERVFAIASDGRGKTCGVADVDYCQREDGAGLGDEPAPGETIEGQLIGVVVRAIDGNLLVHLPDGEVYELAQAQVKRVYPAKPGLNRVPV